MKPSDLTEFNAILSDCLSMWSGPPSAGITATWFRTLAGYELPMLSAAFSAHMRDPANGKFEPKPAHIIEQIERMVKNDGRPGPEEAWAISLSARDEGDTVVWTHECAQAWGSSSPIMDMGDEVGARMAFKETYTRLVAEARLRREPASWEVSEGFDKDRRRSAVNRAIEAGRIPAANYLAIGHSSSLESVAYGGVPAEIRQRLAELRVKWSMKTEEKSESDMERERLENLKLESAEKVRRFDEA